VSPRKRRAAPRIARSIYLPPALNERLTSEAERRGLSANDLVILALEQTLGGAPPQQAPAPPAPAGDMLDFD